MATSKVKTDTRTRIMLAAQELAEESMTVEGVTISLESVAKRADLTKPGSMYYFPTKQDLMVGVVAYAAEEWDKRLSAQAGATVESLSPYDRHRAYVRDATTAELSRSDFWVFSDAVYQPALTQGWQEHLAPWFSTKGLPAEISSLLQTARFCADGAWMSEATGVCRADDLLAIQGHALALIDKAEGLAS